MVGVATISVSTTCRVATNCRRRWWSRWVVAACVCLIGSEATDFASGAASVVTLIADVVRLALLIIVAACIAGVGFWWRFAAIRTSVGVQAAAIALIRSTNPVGVDSTALRVVCARCVAGVSDCCFTGCGSRIGGQSTGFRCSITRVKIVATLGSILTLGICSTRLVATIVWS